MPSIGARRDMENGAGWKTGPPKALRRGQYHDKKQKYRPSIKRTDTVACHQKTQRGTRWKKRGKTANELMLPSRLQGRESHDRRHKTQRTEAQIASALAQIASETDKMQKKGAHKSLGKKSESLKDSPQHKNSEEAARQLGDRGGRALATYRSRRHRVQ